MKKIAILTFHTAYNYGAVLQAYSLQEFISYQKGFEGNILDYRSEILEQRNKASANLKKGNPVKNIIMYLLRCKDIKKRNELFDNFRKKYFKIEREALLKSDLSSTNDIYDAFIVGSDQVWNKDIIKDDNSFFFDFVNDDSKKYSYAASIGKTSFSESEENELIENIKPFNCISVRENDVVDDLSEKLNREIYSSLDPVFLYGSDNWRKFSTYNKRKPYILYFMMGMGSQGIPALEFAKKLAREKNLDIVFLSDNERWYKFRDTTHFGVASPNEFVGLIDHADLVVTNSFHATAFSIILHTPFFTETAVLRSNRITSLLDIVGLSDCGLHKGQPIKDSDEIIRSVNWENVDANANRKIKESKEYLQSILLDLK